MVHRHKNLCIGYERPKGFEEQQFDEAFTRYLTPPKISATPLLSDENLAAQGLQRSGLSNDIRYDSQKSATRYQTTGQTDASASVARSGLEEGVAYAKQPSATLQALPIQESSGVADKTGGVERAHDVEVNI